MTDKVHPLKIVKFGAGAHIDCDRVLKAPLKKLQNVVVIGWDMDNNMYFASSDGPTDTLWLLEQAKKELMDGE